MTERQKVMRGLEAHSRPTCETCDGQECPYYRINEKNNVFSCSVFLASDALAVLKEPAQKYVPSIGGARDFGSISSHWYRCGYPECGFPIDRGDIYCRHCGKPIGWEEWEEKERNNGKS